jgi:hypothetical protein
MTLTTGVASQVPDAWSETLLLCFLFKTHTRADAPHTIEIARFKTKENKTKQNKTNENFS